MAEKKEGEVIEVEEPGTVEIDVSDNPDLAKSSGSAPAGAAPPDEEEEEVAAQPNDTQKALDETKRLAEESKRRQEARVKAAEETAVAERQAREKAERQLREQEAALQSQQEESIQRELAIINSGIESTKQEVEALEGEVARLYESGEFAKAASVNTKLVRATSRLDRLEATKTEYEEAATRKTSPHEGRVVEQPRVNADPVEQYVAHLTPKAQVWIRQHRDCLPAQLGGDAQKNSKMMAGHYEAIAQGYEPDSEDYYRVIEEHVGIRQKEQPKSATDPETAPQPQRRAKTQKHPQPSAPPSRTVPTTDGKIPRTTRQVTLTREQQEHAKISFPHLAPKDAFAQYARNLVELEAEGKMGRQTH